MDKQLTNILWLQNNNNNRPQRQQNQVRPNGQNGRQPQGGSSLNRWLLIIVMLMLAIYVYSYFNSGNNTGSSQREELTYSEFYKQINAENIATATFNGQTDIVGDFKVSVNGYKQYHVVQLPNGDPQLSQLLIDHKVTVTSQQQQDNSFWLNLLIAFVPWLLIIGLFIFLSRRAGQGQQGI